MSASSTKNGGLPAKLVPPGSSDDLIELTPNPYVAFGLRLGRDEINAWLISTGATLTASGLLLLAGSGLSGAARAAILSLVGPVAEKPGLFFHYIREALREYRAARPEKRESRWHYVRKVLREGWPSLRADLFYHDPAYAILLCLLLQVTGSQSVAGVTLLAGVSFVAAIAIASVLEVLWVDFSYFRLHRCLRRAGFVTKCYYEARFLVDPDGEERFSPQQVLDRLQKHFGLPVRVSYQYRDRYLTKHSLAVYNGRKPYLRFRQRLAADGSVSKQAVQVMYTRSREVRDQRLSVYRCFASLKDKSGYDFPLETPMPWSAKDIPVQGVDRIVRRLGAEGQAREVRFRRELALDPAGLFISIDLSEDEPGSTTPYWLELKSRDDLEALRAASAYIAWKLPVRGTTRARCDRALRDQAGTPSADPVR